MYGAADALPAVYAERFRTQIYNEWTIHPGVWNKVVVVAREVDDEAMLNHAPARLSGVARGQRCGRRKPARIVEENRRATLTMTARTVSPRSRGSLPRWRAP